MLVTDIRMPGEKGLNLAKRASASRGSADAWKVVLISGHAMLCDLDSVAPAGQLEFVEEPFRLTELETAIARAHERAVARRTGL